jgi:hypothetical protein
MKTYVLSAMVVIGLTAGAVAQSVSPAAPAQGTAPAPAASSVAGGRKAACQSAAQNLKGQDKRDQMQLCLAQAHLDCVKQAIDQKTVGPQRRDFIRTCIGG